MPKRCAADFKAEIQAVLAVDSMELTPQLWNNGEKSSSNDFAEGKLSDEIMINELVPVTLVNLESLPVRE